MMIDGFAFGRGGKKFSLKFFLFLKVYLFFTGIWVSTQGVNPYAEENPS